MNRLELIEKMNEALAEEFEVDKEVITEDAPIKETLNLDSLSLVDMVALIEDQFGIEIQTKEIGTIKTFKNLYDFTFDKLSQS